MQTPRRTHGVASSLKYTPGMNASKLGLAPDGNFLFIPPRKDPAERERLGETKGGIDLLIQWKDEYLIGHKVIDFDHQMLVSMTNELFFRIESGAHTEEEIAQAIAAFVDYVNRHFAREEGIFMPTDYPDKKNHLRKHAEIKQTVLGISEAYRANPQSINLDEVMEFLKVWLTNHILRTDQTYMPYLEKK